MFGTSEAIVPVPRRIPSSSVYWLISVRIDAADANAKPPAVSPSCNLSVLSSVLTVISPSEPITVVCSIVVPRLICHA